MDKKSQIIILAAGAVIIIACIVYVVSFSGKKGAPVAKDASPSQGTAVQAGDANKNVATPDPYAQGKTFSHVCKDGKSIAIKFITTPKAGAELTLNDLNEKRTVQLALDLEKSKKSITPIYRSADSSTVLTSIAVTYKVTENGKDTFVECKSK